MNNKNNNYKEECISYMSEVGLPLDCELIIDDKIHRYSSDQKKGKRDEWYIAHEGYISTDCYYLVCTFGSWSSGEQYKYTSFGKKKRIASTCLTNSKNSQGNKF